MMMSKQLNENILHTLLRLILIKSLKPFYYCPEQNPVIMSLQLLQNAIFNYLILQRTLPSWKIRNSLLSVVTSWKFAPFSFAKNRSGFQIESNMDGSRSRESSGYSLYARRGSFHFCRRNTLSLQSCGRRQHVVVKMAASFILLILSLN